MSQEKQMTILEFSRLTGITRDNLRFYDKIGLLSPEARGQNGYRYYSRHQLGTAYLIVGLRGIGVGLDTIKGYADERTPEKMFSLFSEQDTKIKAEITRLQEMRKIMKEYAQMAHEALDHGEKNFFLEEKNPEAIFLCPPIPAHMNIDEGWIFSYDYAGEKGVNLGCPLGSIIAKDRLEAGDVSSVFRNYFRISGKGNGWKPGGLYAVAYVRCDPWKSLEKVYRQLLEFIEEQGMIVCGDAYEECPLDDISVKVAEDYCVRVEIPVMPKN